jgi:ABC-type Fe3+-hydroxamate transport system substrate-binding protein
MRCDFVRKGLIRLFGLLIVGFGILGCQIEPPHGPLESEVRENLVRDDLGREVVLRRPIERVVSLAPSLSESIYAVGAGDKLVGVTTYCNYPEAAKAVEKVGDTQTPNIERIVALKPDVVFVSTASQLEAFMRTLDQQGIAVYVMDAKSIGEVFDDLRTLGGLLGMEDSANALVAGLEARVKAVSSREPRRVFIQISNEPLFTIGKDSFLTEVVAKAGGESVTKDVPSGYPKLSKETASAMDPDVIILSDSEDNREPNVVFKNSNAVKNGRVYRINADIISRPGPRLVDALEQIAGFLNR